MTAKASRSDRRPWVFSARIIDPTLPPVPHSDRLRVQAGAVVDFDRLMPRLRGSLLHGVKPEAKVRIIADEELTGPWAVLDAARSRLGRPETRELYDRLVADAVVVNPRVADRAAIASFTVYALSCYALCGEVYADCCAALAMEKNGDAGLLRAIVRDTIFVVEGKPREPTAADLDRMRPGVAYLCEQTKFASSIERFVGELERRRFCAPRERLCVRRVQIHRLQSK